MSDSLFLFGLVSLTSVLAFLLARRKWALEGSGLRAALLRLLECAGLVAGFYVLNVVAGFGFVLVLRKLTGSFISVYVNTDGTLPILSALQAVAFQWWRAESD